MSILLYRLGSVIARHRGLVLAVWALIFVGLIGLAGVLGTHYDDTFTLPGSQSQAGQDLLASRFGQTGTSGQIILTARSGHITDQTNAHEIGTVTAAIGKVPHVSLSNPLKASNPVVSKDGRSTLGQIQFSQQVPSTHTLDAVLAASRTSAASPVATSVGGTAYKAKSETSKVPELLGLLVSFLILCVTFASLITAGMPIITALVGVGVTLSAVVAISAVGTISSTSPTLAEMLGLAVGIDYALFILSRYRTQLGAGVTPREAMGRALATAGSAVVFAGTTVVIALLGLAVARIPVLTVMGLAAAGAVTMAVLIALTLLPAIALLLGERLRPKPRRRRRRRSAEASAEPVQRLGVGGRWVRVATKVPLLTIAVVAVLLLLAASPVRHLELALPDNSTAPQGTAARTTYNDITKAFGPGWNAPLAVTADIITSSDPQGTVKKLAGAIKAVPGVVAVPQYTPNTGADTGLVQVIPKAGQTAPSTAALVKRLRADAPGWEKKYGVSNVLVAGSTAVNIDVSERLGASLLPFGAIVIGLSLLLLMLVFRSIAVPIKATLGYLLSVGTALGAVVTVFQLGWLDALLPGLANGPIVSFLPIFVMGVLFGLAMDYEMFLVSAMREEFVHTGDPRQAVHGGFRASAKVVTAAALIMTSVFIAFIPGGSTTIQPIALGLAVGVFVDAFLVRMTLVPAVLVLLGRWAWWLPGWLDRRLPLVDVEGAAMHRKVDFARWESHHGETAVLARDLKVSPDSEPVQLSLAPGSVVHLEVADPAERRALGQVLVGRCRPASGEVIVAGYLLPEQRALVHRTSTLLGTGPDGAAGDHLRAVDERARLVASSRRGRTAFSAQALQALSALTADGPGAPCPHAIAVEAALALAGGARVVVVTDPEDETNGVERIGRVLGGQGVAVVVLGPQARSPQDGAVPPRGAVRTEELS
ncbi:MAG: MMPL family transporter [Marmoricola sp.]